MGKDININDFVDKLITGGATVTDLYEDIESLGYEALKPHIKGLLKCCFRNPGYVELIPVLLNLIPKPELKTFLSTSDDEEMYVLEYPALSSAGDNFSLSEQAKALIILHGDVDAFLDVVKSIQNQSKGMYPILFDPLIDLHALDVLCYWHKKRTLTEEKLTTVIARNPQKFISGLMIRAVTDITALRLLLTGKVLGQTDIPPSLVELTQKSYTEGGLGRLRHAAAHHATLPIDLTEALNAIDKQVTMSAHVNRLYGILSDSDDLSVGVNSMELQSELFRILKNDVPEATNQAVIRKNDKGQSGLFLAVTQGKIYEYPLLQLLSHISSHALTQASALTEGPNAASVLHVLVSAPDRARVLDALISKCDPSGLAEAALHVSKTTEINKADQKVREITGNAFEMAFQRQSSGAYFTLVHRALSTDNQAHASQIIEHLSSQAEYRAKFAKGLNEVARAKPTLKEALIYFNQVCEAPHVSSILSGERQTLAQYREALTRAVEEDARSKVAQSGLFTFVFGAAPVAQPPAAAGDSYRSPAPATSPAVSQGGASMPRHGS